MAKSDSQRVAVPSGMVRCVVVTPESTLLDTTARQVSLPLFDGQAGIAPGHSPLIGRLGSGAVRITGEGAGSDSVRRVFVDGGFVEVNHDVVTVITQRAVPAEAIDGAQARGELESIRTSRAVGDEAITEKLRRQASSRALVRTAEQGRR